MAKYQYLSWNRIPKLDNQFVKILDMAKIPNKIVSPILVQGNGRSYGDVCLNDQGTLLSTRNLDKFITFNPEKGILKAQSGVLLRDILALVIPQGWFLSVTPGTSLASLGGAVANDVHGKNHHIAGSFGHFVKSLSLYRSTGEVLTCSATENSALFYATIGGLGLTGFIAEVEIQLQRIHNPLMWCENRAFDNLEEYWQLNAEMQPIWPCSASWVDCVSKGKKLGRGIMFLGQHASAHAQPLIPKKKQLSIPYDIPFSLVNTISLHAFNELYFHKNKKNKVFFSDYRPFFYPLDSILHWNRIYGSRGFYQYQCVLPPETEKDGVKALLDEIQKSGQGSFLAVLKSFGSIPSLGMLSFPRLGTTLALDFPDKGTMTLKLFERLDSIVREAKGALYPAKDARMSAEMFELSYPKLSDFCQYIDPEFSSHFWERMQK